MFLGCFLALFANVEYTPHDGDVLRESPKTCFHVVYIQHVALKRLTFSNSERTGKIVTEENVAILSL